MPTFVRALNTKASWLLAALFIGGGCGGSGEWIAPPVSALPVWPGPPEAPPPAEPAAKVAPAAPPAPTPISGDLPADADLRLGAFSECILSECLITTLYPPMQVIDGKAPAAVWSHAIAQKGMSIVFPKHAEVDLYGVVLKGTVKLKGDGLKASVSVKKWSAFHAPGAGVFVTAGEDDARVLFAIVGGGKAIGEIAEDLRKGDAKRFVWKSRPGAFEAVDLAAAKDLAWANGAVHARIGFEGATQKASLGILIASNDAPVPAHTHDGSWEMLAALKASGTMKRADQPGSTDLASSSLADGAVVAMPKGTLHAWEPDKTKPLVAVQLYVPAGPEQRFKKLAEDAAKPSAR